jgi:hypothetical protein
MRKTNEKSIGKVIDDMITENNLSDGIAQVKINAVWLELMSQPIISRTSKLRFYQGKLTIFLTSAVIRNELDYQKEELRKQFNEKIGEELVLKIEFN